MRNFITNDRLLRELLRRRCRESSSKFWIRVRSPLRRERFLAIFHASLVLKRKLAEAVLCIDRYLLPHETSRVRRNPFSRDGFFFSKMLPSEKFVQMSDFHK